MIYEKFKKFLAVFVALCLVLSVTLCLFPPLEVLAYDSSYSNQYYLKDIEFLKNITSSKLFTQSDYLNGIDNPANISNYGEDVLKNAQDENSGASFFFDDVGNSSFYQQIVNFFDNKSSAGSFTNAFNDIYFYSQASNTSNNYKIMNDFFTHPDNYTYYYIIYANGFSNNDPKIYIDFYISTGNFNAIAMPGSGYVFNSTQTIFNMHNCLTGDYENNYSSSISLLPRSTSGGWGGSIGVDNYCLYSNIPTYFTFENNGITGNDYSQFSDKITIKNTLANGGSSPFLIDRRLLLSSYAGTPDYSVSTDPLSQNNVGVYDFDFYPTGGVISGVYVIDNLQLSAKTSEMEDVNLYALISYNFTCNNGFYSTVTAVPIVENYILQNMNTKISQYGIISSNNLETSIPLDDTSYQTFSARSILRDSGPVDDGKRSYYVEDHVRRSISMLHLYGISDALQLVSPSQTSPKTIVQSTGAITNFTVACSIKIDYGNGQTSTTLGTIVYDYLTGQSTKSGLTSTDNNTPLEDISPTIQGQLNDINSGGFNSGVGGNTVNGGNNSNVNNSTFTNNNNPTITINNNNGLNEPDGVPENPDEGSFSMLWSIWESYHFAEWLNQDLEENGFLHYIFSSQIWDLPIFNLIIPALAILITVSIASTIIRFIRGN